MHSTNSECIMDTGEPTDLARAGTKMYLKRGESMEAKIIKVEEAVGKMLSHDLTKIVKGEFKGPAFRKGHIIKEEDIEELRRIGKEHIYVLELGPDDVHEDEAGVRLGQATAGTGVIWRGPKESRVNLFADIRGLLHIDVPALEALNDLPDVVMATLPTNTVVNPGDMLAGTKVIPLVVKNQVVEAAEQIAAKSPGVIRVLPFQSRPVGLIVTGSEVYKGLIEDRFGPVLQEKIELYGGRLLRLEYAPDDAGVIAGLIKKQLADGAEMVLVSGGMSVDPDDTTPTGIKLSGAVIEKYGAPALPGAMFMLAYLNEIPILGVPACGMFFRTTVLDLIMPRIMAGQKVTRRDIVGLAHGGLCRSCPTCNFPNCSFGKGSYHGGNL